MQYSIVLTPRQNPVAVDQHNYDSKQFKSINSFHGYYWQKIASNKTPRNLKHAKPGTFHSNDTLAWWRHQMKTISALLALCAGNSTVTGKFPPQRPVIFVLFCERPLIFSLIFAWKDGWANSPDIGELKCYRTHYDIAAMSAIFTTLVAITCTTTLTQAVTALVLARDSVFFA